MNDLARKLHRLADEARRSPAPTHLFQPEEPGYTDLARYLDELAEEADPRAAKRGDYV